MQNTEFLSALEGEAKRRTVQMLEGVHAYQDINIEREETPHRVIWKKANARLLDYGGDKDSPILFCVPSLINRHYILDLYPERSFVRFLTGQGFRVLVLDWGEPGTREKRYGCGEYVDYLLLDALRSVRQPVHLFGYCMGGILALAAAQLKPDNILSLGLLATPWQFVAPDTLNEEGWESFEDKLMKQDTIPPLWTQSFFHLLDPFHFQEKFARFKEMSAKEQYHFAAVESWVNDGVPLSRYVAKECYIDWPRNQALSSGEWHVGGQAIRPSSIQCPTFIATPTNDRIVPLSSSEPLATQISHAKRIKPDTGHVSMVVGSQAKKALWQPLVKWLNSI